MHKDGGHAKRTTNLGMENIPGFPAFVRGKTRKGLTTDEVSDLAGGEGQQFIADFLEGSGLEVTDENIARLTNEFNLWGQGSLVGGETVQRLRNPAYTASTASNFPTSLFPEESGLVEIEQSIPATPSRKEATLS